MDTIDGKTVSFEDTSFTSSDSPKIIDLMSELGREARTGYLANDGSGNLQFAISYDGTNYGGTHTLLSGETVEFDDMFINKLKITHITNTSYRILLA